MKGQDDALWPPVSQSHRQPACPGDTAAFTQGTVASGELPSRAALRCGYSPLGESKPASVHGAEQGLGGWGAGLPPEAGGVPALCSGLCRHLPCAAPCSRPPPSPSQDPAPVSGDQRVMPAT